MIGQDIVDRVERILKDVDNVRWPSTLELLKWINDGQKQIVLYRPDANSQNVTETLLANSGTKQALPANGSRLLRVVRNIKAGGGGGRAIRKIQREALDNELPDWHESTDDGEILHYAFDNIDPKTYYVYPGVGTSDRDIEIIYLKIPEDAANLTVDLELDDEYRPPLVDYVIARAFMKDAEYAGNLERAQAHMQMFGAALGVQLDITFSAATPANSPRGDASGSLRRPLA